MPYRIVQVYWYFDERTGEFHHRIGKPAQALSEQGVQVLNLHVYHPLLPVLAREADLLILHFAYQPEFHQLIQYRKALARPTLFEIADNFLTQTTWLREDDPFRNPNVRGTLLHYASLSDGLQFSTPALEQHFAFLNETHITWENTVQPPPSLPQKGPGFHFGWGGSMGHEQDIAWSAPAICAFCRKHPRAVFHYMGFKPYFDNYFHDLPDTSKRFRKAGPIEDWFDFISRLHVGIAPLLDSGFNLSRTDVKFLEYASRGAVPLLSDHPVYRRHQEGDRAMFFSTPEELETRLEQLYRQPETRTRLAQNAYEYVKTVRSPAADATQRIAHYQTQIPHQPHPKPFPEIPPFKDLISLLRKAVSFHESKQYQAALLLLSKELLPRAPDFEAAHLWVCKNMSAMGLHEPLLKNYAEFQPSHLYGDLFNQFLYLAAEKAAPEHKDLFLNRINNPVRKLHLNTNRGLSERRYYQTVLEHNPFDYWALTQFAKYCENRPREQNLYQSLKARIQFINPDN